MIVVRLGNKQRCQQIGKVLMAFLQWMAIMKVLIWCGLIVGSKNLKVHKVYVLVKHEMVA